jgi:hypothetical protein
MVKQSCLENFLEVRPEPIHDEEPVFFTIDHVTATASVARHSQRSQAPIIMQGFSCCYSYQHVLPTCDVENWAKMLVTDQSFQPHQIFARNKNQGALFV